MNYAKRIEAYCHSAVANALPNRQVCELEKLACQRHLDDLKKQSDPDYPYYFSEDACNNRCYFTECLPHVKGKWAGDLIELEDWQIFIQGVTFGWLKKSSGNRRFIKSNLFVPRKNGKSLEAGTTGLYMAFADDEPGSEVYSVAGTEKQAWCVFKPAWIMVQRTDALSEHFNLKLSGTIKNPTAIYCEEDDSTFMPLVGNPGDGTSPHCAIIDEYHEASTSVGYDAMNTGMDARDNSLLLMVSTSGVNTSYPCYDVYLESVKILEGTTINDTVFCMIFAIDKDDDWQDFEVWKKVNPNYGVSIDKDKLYSKYLDALNKPNERNVLLTKHLNIWQNAGVGFLDMLRWNKCTDESLKLEDFLGQECWLALDLASKIDLAALVMLFKHKRKVINANCPKCYSDVEIINGFNICTGSNKLEDGTICGWGKPVMRDCIVGFARHYLPEETVLKKENQHYQKWDLEGHLIVTEGARTDFHRIEEDLQELDRQFIVKELTFDPKEASYLIQNIQEWSGFECIEFEQGPATISQPMKELEAQVMAMEFWHNGNPVYTWCMGNVIKKKARSGGSVKHYFPTKENDNLKIDSAVATICALGRLISYDEEEGAYDSRVASGEESIVRVL